MKKTLRSHNNPGFYYEIDGQRYDIRPGDDDEKLIKRGASKWASSIGRAMGASHVVIYRSGLLAGKQVAEWKRNKSNPQQSVSNQISDLVDEALNPQLSREEVIFRVKKIQHIRRKASTPQIRN
ncbi:MAG TPA: hypothetical protein VG206_13920 [Terriglobia bacterium]|nr:hypothetical protein [Terriglobia bacterium]